MAKTVPMKLIELMILKRDIHSVLKYLGEFGQFQFQQNFEEKTEDDKKNPDKELCEALLSTRAKLNLSSDNNYNLEINLPSEEEYKEAEELISNAQVLFDKELELNDKLKSVEKIYDETMAFSNLKVSYSQLESMSFLTFRIGSVPDESRDSLKYKLGSQALLVPLGNDNKSVLVACSKANRISVDKVLNDVHFIEYEIPSDFKGVPDDAIESLEKEKVSLLAEIDEIVKQRKNFAQTHEAHLQKLIAEFSISAQIYEVENKLESTEFVYRITGWIPSYLSHDLMKNLDKLTEGRVGIRCYLPSEVESVVRGEEKIPVQVKHKGIVKNFERMVFSYGSPLYGTVDPTPFVALFFTLLFGIMFGDLGQGLIFLLVGILMKLKLFKLSGWEKFSTIFICIGVSSSIMGILTGEFFANETVLQPFAYWVTGLFGEPQSQILPMMPSQDSSSIIRMFMFFGFTIAVGFIINSTGIIINIVNQFTLGKKGKAIFGKTGITGSIFFWYVVYFALKVTLFKGKIAVYDWIIIGTSLFLTAFSEVFERLVDGKRPVFENGVFSALIAAIVELIEIISSYLSNTVSFVRVGAFALAHAVLGYIIESIVGNAIVVVLEGMIVAIQVVRLQYYEFFSKFFFETGREFKPFRFEYK